MRELAAQIESNTRMMMILFDERKEMILKLMDMVKELHKTAIDQREENLLLKAEILRLRAKGGK
jgi:hypothetical protein